MTIRTSGCARLVAAIIGVVATLPAFATSTLVVSQFRVRGPTGGNDEFIELHNAGASAVSIGGYKLRGSSNAGAIGDRATLPAGASIGPGCYYLLTNSAGYGGSVVGDATYSTGISDDGGLALTKADNTIIDAVGLSAGSAFKEGTPLTSLGSTNADKGYERKPGGAAGNGTDTDDNSADFLLADPTHPRNSASACVTGGGPTSPSGSGSANPASVAPGGSTLLTVTVTPGTNPASTGLAVNADLSAIGGSSTQTLVDAGGNVFTFTANVGAGISAGTKSLPVTITDAQSRSGSTTIALTVTAAPLTIMQIQGDGAASPRVGETVTTAGNIVTAVGPKGFFMQDPVGGVPNTSSGLYVYTASAPTVHVGDAVTVTGKVAEFSGSTELTGPVVSVTSSGNALPAAYVFDDNPPSSDPTAGPCQGSVVPATDGYQASNFACLDGMLVTIREGVVTGPTYASGADAVRPGTPSGLYATIASQPRPFRGPGALFPGLGGTIPVWGGEPEVIQIYYPGLAFNPAGYVMNAGARFSATGVIQGYQASGATFPIYELFPSSMSLLDAGPAYPQPIRESATGTLTIGTQNMLHFFNATADSPGVDDCINTAAGSKDVCPTADQYSRRLRKMSLQVRDVLKAPVVLAVQEVENYATLGDLADQIRADSGGAVDYRRYTLPGNDVGGINIGLLVRAGVTVQSVTQLYKDTQTTACSGTPPCLLNDRPPVLLQATYNGYPFAVLAIYNRSLINIGTPGRDYIGRKRTEQAVQVASIVQAWQSGGTIPGYAQQDASGLITPGPLTLQGDANVPLVVLGDFNAYEFTDGYADVTGLIMGTADPTQNWYWDTLGTYVPPSPTLVDSGTREEAANRYSYTYSGIAQAIDHILLSRVAARDFIGISHAHGNADVTGASGIVLDDSTAAGSSDHDGQVLTLVIDRIFADGYEQRP
jgi:predicted extracellular nuclease